MAFFERPVVSATWLGEQLGAVDIADVRWSVADGPHLDAYLAAHLPGAVFVDLDVDLSDPPGQRGRHPLPPVSTFRESLARLGLGRRPLVCYDDAGGAIAARMWWMMSVLGFDVAVLDGGVSHWPGPFEHGPVGEMTAPESAGDAASSGDSVSNNILEDWPSDRVVDVDHVLARISNGDRLLDARSAERFAGAPGSIDKRPGHIPGSHSRPWTENVGDDGRMLSAIELREQFARSGVDQESHGWFASCGSGVTGCHNILAATVAGLAPGALYVGSWSEWSQSSDRPVATDESPS